MPMNTQPSFLSELKRRNVIRAAVLYIGAVWALAQGIAQLSPAIGLPEMAARWFLIATTIGFPFWLAFAWFYEWTPQGLKRERDHGRCLDCAFEQSQIGSRDHHGPDCRGGVAADGSSCRAQERWRNRDSGQVHRSVAVAQRKRRSAAGIFFRRSFRGADFRAGQVRDLKVIGRNSSFRFRGKDQDDISGNSSWRRSASLKRKPS